MKKNYIVYVDDNFHFTDENQRYKSGEYDTYSEAVKKCKSIVDEYLISALEPGMTARQLYGSYTMFGEDPYIDGKGQGKFSSWDYAEHRSLELTKH